jgi:hypothetical protein
MAQFVFVAGGISSALFEKALEIKIESGVKVTFVPQAVNNHGVSSQSMSSAKQNPQAQEILHNVRFEWDESGAPLGAEIVRVLGGHHRHAEKQLETAA